MGGEVIIRFVGPAHWRRVIGAYRWRPGHVLEVDEETGAYCLAEPGGAFELVVEEALTPTLSRGEREDEWELEEFGLGLERRG